jgi:putative nucleotidyltransferase with HDIG domain
MQAIDDYINSVRYLPPAPKTVPELMKLLNQADADTNRVVKLISLDQSLTANLLRMCNSAYYGAAVPITDLQEGVTRLGFQQVYQLVVAASSAKMLSPPQKGYGLAEGDLWKHSVATAVAAQLLASRVGDDVNLAFTTALLHDIGKIILTQSLENIYFKLLRETEIKQQSLLETEKQLLGVDHAEVGSRLLSRWKFSPGIVSAVWFHHSPRAAGSYQRLAATVYLANMVAHFMGHGYGHLAFALRGRSEALTILGLEPEFVPQLMMETFEQIQLVDTLLGMAA